MTGSSDRAARALGLFDELVELPRDARETRLGDLASEDAALADELRRMLDADAARSGLLDHALEHGGAGEPDRAPPRSIGAFEPIRLLGRGGMGEVWLAERQHEGFRQQVALKLLRRGVDSEDSLRRFQQERRILAGLSHPDIARFIDGGVTGAGVPWYAMEHVDGVPITAHADAQQHDVRKRVALMVRVAAAVAYAQQHLIVHRDLKPSNILVDADGRPHLLDFGIAKLLEESAPGAETATGLRAMSPSYAAPEQVLDAPISTATDVYALGVVLFELLTGSLPHERAGATLETLAEQVRTEVTERPSQRVRRERAAGAPGTGIDAELDLIVLTALRRERERRYANAAAFGDDLQRWLEGRPIAAQPDSTRYRMRKFVARHRLAVGSAAAVVLALLAGIGVATWQARIARAQATRAETELRRAEALKTFALSLFREQDPFARGKPTPRSASELIALGIERAREQFAGEVAERTELLNDLGEIQTSLGEPAAARAVLEQVSRETAAAFGERSVEHAAAQSNLGSTLMALGDYPGALAILERAAATLEDLAGPDAPVTLVAQQRRVHAMTVTGPLDRALGLGEDLAKRNERVFGRDATETLVQLADVGSIQENLDRLDAAEATGREVVARMERVLGPDHAQLVRPLGRLGDIMRRETKLAEADALYARAIAIARKQSSPLMTGALLMRRGDLLRRQQRYDEAAQHLDEAASLLPPGGPELAQVDMFRGMLARARGDLRGGADAFMRSYRAFRAVLGADSPLPWHAAIKAAETEGMLGLARGAEAEPLLLEAAANLRRIAAPDSFDVMTAAGAVAAWRTLQGRHADATPLWREQAEISTHIYGADHESTIDARLSLASSLVAQGDAGSLIAARAELERVTGAKKMSPELGRRAEELAARLR